MVHSQCSQKNFPSSSSSQRVPKRFFHHSLHLFILLDALTTSLCWKRWCIPNVPKKTFPSFSSSQHCPWHSHLESKPKMLQKNGLKTEEIVRWPGTESTLLLNKVYIQRMELLQCDHVCLHARIPYLMKRSRRKIMGYSTRHFLLLFFLLGMLRLFDHMVVSGAKLFLTGKTLPKRNFVKAETQKINRFWRVLIAKIEGGNNIV